jgi:GT2 family glycosyltransferase
MAVSTSIIIVTFNAHDALKAMLGGLKVEEAPGVEVIVVDSGSFDATPTMVRERFADVVRLVELEKNAGFATAANAGIARSQGDVVVICHADLLASAHDLTELADIVREGAPRRVAAAIPRLIGVDGSELPTVGPIPGFWRNLAGVFSPGMTRKRHLPALDHLADHEWADLICVAIDAAAMTKLGGFDERFFLYFHDMDLCQRLHEASLRMVIRREISVVHTGDRKRIAPHRVRLMRNDLRKLWSKHRSALEQSTLRVADKATGILRRGEEA